MSYENLSGIEQRSEALSTQPESGIMEAGVEKRIVAQAAEPIGAQYFKSAGGGLPPSNERNEIFFIDHSKVDPNHVPAPVATSSRDHI